MEIADVSNFLCDTTPFDQLSSAAVAGLSAHIKVYYYQAGDNVNINTERLLIVRTGIFTLYSDQQQLLHARQHGWISSVKLEKDGQLHLDGFGQLLRYQEQWIVLDQSQMYYKHAPGNRKKSYVSLSAIPNKPSGYDDRWRTVETCSYWYNYE